MATNGSGVPVKMVGTFRSPWSSSVVPGERLASESAVRSTPHYSADAAGRPVWGWGASGDARWHRSASASPYADRSSDDDLAHVTTALRTRWSRMRPMASGRLSRLTDS